MLSRIRHSAVARLLWGIMGLHLLNTSVDLVDLNDKHLPEDLSFNDQESIVEIVVEQVLGYENAIKEYDDHDTEDQNDSKNIKIDVLISRSIENRFDVIPNCDKQSFITDPDRVMAGFKERLKRPPIA